MTREIGKLNSAFVKAVKEPGLHSDGGSLYLQIKEYATSDGGAGIGKSWIFRFTPKGGAKPRHMGLGSLDTFSLAEAREIARKLRQDVHSGLDPIAEREKKRHTARLAEARAMTFEQVARAYIEARRPEWSNAKHALQWTSTLEQHAFPVLGKISIQDVTVDLVLQVLKPIWVEKAETASRLQQRVKKVLDYAKAAKLREGENAAAWEGNLDQLLPAKSKVKKVRHHPALAYKDMGTFIPRLRALGSTSAFALEFTILTAVRTSEAIGAQLAEVDFREAVWTIPASRMKMDKEHRVPLCARAIAIIKAVERPKGCTYLFPGEDGASLSSMAMLECFQGMRGCEGLTVHGFRSSFRDWVGEETNYPSDIAEAALAHAIKNKVAAAYQRGDLLRKRRHLMDAWSAYIGKPAPVQKGDNVRSIGGRA